MKFPEGQLSADSSSTETLYCHLRMLWLELVCEIATFSQFGKSQKNI